MKHSKAISNVVVVIVLTLSFVFSAALMGQAQDRTLDNADLKGAYGICLTFGPTDGAGVGAVIADGRGFLRDGWVLLHVPSGDEKGGVLRGQVAGTYEINRNGTATMVMRFIFPDRVVDRNFDMIVQELDRVGVVELAGALRETTTLVPSKGATLELERLPDGVFDDSSLQGRLALNLEFESQIAIAFGTITADGKGNLVDGTLVINASGADGQRVVVRSPMSGSYAVAPGGKITIHLLVDNNSNSGKTESGPGGDAAKQVSIFSEDQAAGEITFEGVILEADEGGAPTETLASARMKMIKRAHFSPMSMANWSVCGVNIMCAQEGLTTVEQPGGRRVRVTRGFIDVWEHAYY